LLFPKYDLQEEQDTYKEMKISNHSYFDVMVFGNPLLGKFVKMFVSYICAKKKDD